MGIVKRFLLSSLQGRDTRAAIARFLKRVEPAVYLGILPATGPVPEDPCRVMGLVFPNRVGLASGFNLSGESTNALGALGFGFLESGPVTLHGCAGGPSRTDAANRRIVQALPRPSASLAQFLAAQGRFDVFGLRGGVLGASLGDDSAENVLACAGELFSKAQYLVLSAELLAREGLALPELFLKLAAAREEHLARTGSRVALLVKPAADMNEAFVREVARQASESGFDGVVACDSGLTGKAPSGSELLDCRDAIIRIVKEVSGGSMAVVASSGVLEPEDAVRAVRAGADLVEVFSGFVFSGPDMLARSIRALARKGCTHA